MPLRFLQPKSGNTRPQDCSDSDGSARVYVDNDLVRRVRQGDVDAFEELFNRHQKRVYNIALRILGDDTEAADATQDVFVKAYENIGKLSSDAAFVTWLKTLTVNHCRDVLRHKARVRFDSLDAPVQTNDGEQMGQEIADSSADPQAVLDETVTRETVARAIDGLSPDYKEVVTLFYLDGSDIAEIAKITGAPAGTIKSRLSRARSELKRKLESFVRD